MQAMVLRQPGRKLECVAVARPEPGPEQVLVEVHARAVRRTRLHVVDGDLTRPTRQMLSSASLTRGGGDAFLAIAPRMPLRPIIESLALKNANTALQRPRDGVLTGATVLLASG